MSDRRPHDVYRNLLLRERHGYPLWIPESDYNLPDVYRDKGVSVGDLGILTDDGGFDFLFNVCAEADDPVNCGRVPPQFQPLRISCRSSHAIQKIPYHCRNSSITSAQVSKTELTIEGIAQITPLVTGGGEFEFILQSAEAAILMLPDGGNRYDTMHRALFEQYAIENGHSWYIYVNSLEYLARQAPNGSLYLVTGCDKARTWMIAAASRPSRSHAISVRFAIGPIMDGRIALQTSWSTPHSASAARIYPDYPDPMPQQDNQCVFMRGFTITVRENSLIQKMLGPVQLKVIGGSSKNAAPSFSSRSPYSSYQGNSAGSSSSRVLSSTGPVDNFEIPDYSTNEDPKPLLKDSIELIDLPGRSTELLNPSAKINEYLLTLNPHITVAVTHDEDWMEVTKDLPPDEWPDDFKLASMVFDLFEKRSTQFLVLNGQQPPTVLDPPTFSRLMSTHKRTADDEQQRRGWVPGIPMPKVTRMLNGRVYGQKKAQKERILSGNPQDAEPKFIEEKYGGMGRIKSSTEAAWKMLGKEQSKGMDDDIADKIARMEKRMEETERKIHELLEVMKKWETKRVSLSPLILTPPSSSSPTNHPTHCRSILSEHSVRVVRVQAVSLMRQKQFVMQQTQSADVGAVVDDSNSHDEKEYSDGEEDEDEEEAQRTTVLGAGVEKISRHRTAT